jgi:hypothetical protein
MITPPTASAVNLSVESGETQSRRSSVHRLLLILGVLAILIMCVLHEMAIGWIFYEYTR